MSFMDRLRSTEVSSRAVTICVGVVILVGAVVIVTAKNMANNASAKPRRSIPTTVRAAKLDLEIKEHKTQKTDAKTTGKTEAKGKSKTEAAKVATVSDDPYAVIIERNLFKPIGAQAASAGKGGAQMAKSGPSGRPPSVPTLPPMPKPGGDAGESRKNLAYTGMVELPDGPQALIENISSKETTWKRVGETAFGCRIVSISERSISLDKDGASFRLSIGENKSDTDPGTKGAAPPSGSGSPPSGSGGPSPSEGRSR